MEKTKYWIEENASVAHRDIPTLKMRVVKICKEIRTGKDNTKVVRMLGIACTWFDKNNSSQNALFHTRDLIPWEVAEKGEKAINKWLQQ